MSRRWTRSLRGVAYSVALLLSGAGLLTGGIVASGPAYADSLCGAPANTLGINYCGTGVPITKANLPSSTCSYFDCIENFNSGTGYMVECKDGGVSLGGGKPGACANHGGTAKQAYLAASTAPATTAPPPTVASATTSPPSTTSAPTTTAAPATAAASGPLPTTGVGPGVAVAMVAGAALLIVGGIGLVVPRWRRRRT